MLLPCAITDEAIETMTPQEVESRLAQFLSLNARHENVERALKSLQERALALDVYLALDKIPPKELSGLEVPGFPSPEQKELDVGSLYRFRRRRYEEVVVRTTRNTYRSWRLSVLRSRYWSHTTQESFFHSRVNSVERRLVRYITEWEKLRLDLEPEEIRRAQLEERGFECYLFDLTDDGYISQDGESLESIMRRCDLDERFRQRCAVFLPGYEQKLTEGTIKTKYLIILAPLPGLDIVSLPEIYLEEQLAYRADWAGSEVGEILHSMSLAPGEKRQVSVSRQFKRETSESRSITSVLDVTRKDSIDLSTSMENTAERERSDTRTKKWNAKASGGFLGFSASAGGGGSKSMTAKQFARHVQSIATKASHSLEKNTRQEISESRTVNTSFESAESTVGTVENINQGRSLNLMFHRLNNVFRAASSWRI